MIRSFAVFLLLFILSFQPVSSVQSQSCPTLPIPGGGTITFTSNRDGNWQLFVLDGDECHVIQLTHDPNGARGAAWSRDGSKVVYLSGTELYTMNVDGSNNTRLLSSAPSTLTS